MTFQQPPIIGDALFAKAVPAHVCRHIPRTKDELVVDGSAVCAAAGVFFVRGQRVVVYVRQARVLCNTSTSVVTAEWTS